MVAPDADGVFHPKVWVLRFLTKEGEVLYRVLCLSRNLTFDRCWDTVVALDGTLTDRSNAISANHPLGDFVLELPLLALRKLPLERRQAIANMADELRRVRFSWPSGLNGDECRFWVGGLQQRAVSPFGARRDKALVISPFLSERVVCDFIEHSGETHLVSRPESLQELSPKTLRDCASVHVLARELAEGNDDDLRVANGDEVLDGLHAKLFVIDRGWYSSVLTGSFNATRHALERNVEFMVELVGRRSEFGVDKFLRLETGETKFADLLQPYDVNKVPERSDGIERQFDELFQQIKRTLAAALPKLEVTACSEAELFNLTLEWTHRPVWPKGNQKLIAWPITLPTARAVAVEAPITFTRLSYTGLTPLMAFSISAQIGASKSEVVFVMNLPLIGAPEDRQDRVLRSLIDNREQLLRYILFLLAAGDKSAALGGDLRRLLRSSEHDGPTAASNPYLLETMLRALHREPAQLDRVASLLDALRRAPGSSKLLTDEFQSVWNPIWEAAQQEVGK